MPRLEDKAAHPMPIGALLPDWPAPPNVRALCTTRGTSRDGGLSLGPYARLNLGDHVGDRPEHVAGNRQLLREAVGARPVFLRQVHGTTAWRLDGDSPDGLEADACHTQDVGMACTVMVADCLPVLLCDAAGRQVGAAHCGWRGLAGGVLERLCEAFGTTTGGGLIAWLGPCIGPRAFEVGAEVKAAFEAHAPQAAACFTPSEAPGKWMADLAGLARQRLRALGVAQIHGNNGSPAWCTVGNASRFFSYRRDGAASGRFAALVWRE